MQISQFESKHGSRVGQPQREMYGPWEGTWLSADPGLPWSLMRLTLASADIEGISIEQLPAPVTVT